MYEIKVCGENAIAGDNKDKGRDMWVGGWCGVEEEMVRAKEAEGWKIINDPS